MTPEEWALIRKNPELIIKKIEELEKDAARYRWLIENGVSFQLPDYLYISEEELDAAINSAAVADSAPAAPA